MVDFIKKDTVGLLLYFFLLSFMRAILKRFIRLVKIILCKHVLTTFYLRTKFHSNTNHGSLNKYINTDIKKT